MSKQAQFVHGEVMDLIWPEGNDEGEFNIRGHVDFDTAKRALIRDSDTFDGWVTDTYDDPLGVTDEEIVGRMENFLEKADIRHAYGRWSCEPFDDEPNGVVLRTYTQPGRGRFPITQIRVQPIKHERDACSGA